MKNKFLVFIIVILVLILTFLFVSLLSLLKGGHNEKKSTTITPTTTVPEKSLSVIYSSIKDKGINVSLSSPLIIKFNKNIENQSISTSILPEQEIVSIIENNTLTITPVFPFHPSTIYSLTITSNPKNSLLASFVFTTEGPTPTTNPDTRPANEPYQTDEKLKNTRPDVYLSNKAPYFGQDFSVTYEFIKTPKSHFAFNVTLLNNKESSKKAFVSWVRSFGISENQIEQLDIRYK